MSYLGLSEVQKTYPDGTRAVRGVDLEVERGRFVVLLGPSGCGKTTTLRMVAGLEACTGGRIDLDGREVTGLRPSQRNVGMVFQFYALYPHLSVRENIAFPLRAVGVSKSDADTQVCTLAERLGVTPLLDRSPRTLSGGDQQRVSLARALVRSPKLQLMDEPLGTLDADGRQALREVIRDRHLTEPVTTLYVTHDQEEAMVLADQVVVMANGVIRQTATPRAVYDTPVDLFVARFVGSPGMNLCEGRLVVEGAAAQFVLPGGSSLPLPKAPAPSKPAVLGIRSEYCRIDPTGALEATVAVVEYLGFGASIHVDGPFGRWVVRAPLDVRVEVGERVKLWLDPEHMLWFDPETERAL